MKVKRKRKFKVIQDVEWEVPIGDFILKLMETWKCFKENDKVCFIYLFLARLT